MIVGSPIADGTLGRNAALPPEIESVPYDEVDTRSWEEFEEGLEKLRKTTRDARPPGDIRILFRGQEDACWPLTTTLERWSEGNAMSFHDYYEFIYSAKAEIESHTQNRWDLAEPPELRGLTGSYEPFARFTVEEFREWGQIWSYMVHLRHHGFPSPFLDWTRSHYVAAFFAFRRPTKNPVSILAYCESLNPVELPKGSSSGQPEIKVLPRQYFPTDRRHFLQRGEYTVCLQNIDQEWHIGQHEAVVGRSDPNTDVIWKFNLPASERRRVLRLLDTYNFNAFALFQSDESLMETLAFRESV